MAVNILKEVYKAGNFLALVQGAKLRGLVIIAQKKDVVVNESDTPASHYIS